MGANKNNKKDNKPDYSLIPRILMDQVSYAMMAGEDKYGRYNYCKGHSYNQLLAAAERHIKAIQEGEDIDRDTSDRVGVEVTHAACVVSNMLMLLHQVELETITDDRFKPAQKEKEFDTDGAEIITRHSDGSYDVAVTRRFMDGTNTFYETRNKRNDRRSPGETERDVSSRREYSTVPVRPQNFK